MASNETKTKSGTLLRHRRNTATPAHNKLQEPSSKPISDNSSDSGSEGPGSQLETPVRDPFDAALNNMLIQTAPTLDSDNGNESEGDGDDRLAHEPNEKGTAGAAAASSKQAHVVKSGCGGDGNCASTTISPATTSTDENNSVDDSDDGNESDGDSDSDSDDDSTAESSLLSTEYDGSDAECDSWCTESSSEDELDDDDMSTGLEHRFKPRNMCINRISKGCSESYINMLWAAEIDARTSSRLEFCEAVAKTDGRKAQQLAAIIGGGGSGSSLAPSQTSVSRHNHSDSRSDDDKSDEQGQQQAQEPNQAQDQQQQSARKPWDELTREERKAANLLGFHKDEWDRSLQKRVSIMQRNFLFEIHHGLPMLFLVVLYCFGNAAIYDLVTCVLHKLQLNLKSIVFDSDDDSESDDMGTPGTMIYIEPTPSDPIPDPAVARFDDAFHIAVAIVGLAIIRYTGYLWYWSYGLKGADHYRAAKLEMHNRLRLGYWDARCMHYMRHHRTLFGVVSLCSFYMVYIATSHFFSGSLYAVIDTFIADNFYKPILTSARHHAMLPEEPPHFTFKAASCHVLQEYLDSPPDTTTTNVSKWQASFVTYWCHWTPESIGVAVVYNIGVMVTCVAILRHVYGYDLFMSAM